MTKFVNDAIMDAGLNEWGNNATEMHVCSGDPADRAAVIAASLATVTPTYTGPEDGDVTGRKLTSDQKVDIPVTATGTAATVCHIDATRLLVKTNVNPTQPLTIGNQVTVPAHSDTIADPT